MKKSSEKVRVTVKPRLLFRVSSSLSGFCCCVYFSRVSENDIGSKQRKGSEFQQFQLHTSLTCVCPSLQPLEQQHGVVPDPDAEYHLFDRVVNVRESFSVPLGLRGTVIGIKAGEWSHAHPNAHSLTLSLVYSA